MSDRIIKAHIVETQESDFAVTIDVSGHVIKGDETVEAGGANLGPAPFDVLTAALGECTAMTVRWYAKQQNWPLEKVEVNIEYQKITNENGVGKTDQFIKHITIIGDKLTDEQRKKLVVVAGKCPVQRTMEGTPIIKTEAA